MRIAIGELEIKLCEEFGVVAVVCELLVVAYQTGDLLYDAVDCRNGKLVRTALLASAVRDNRFERLTHELAVFKLLFAHHA